MNNSGQINPRTKMKTLVSICMKDPHDATKSLGSCHYVLNKNLPKIYMQPVKIFPNIGDNFAEIPIFFTARVCFDLL